MKKISVLMSLYNETNEEIKSSIDSVFNQTYCSVELIIVIDNPEKRDEYRLLLKRLYTNNKQIIVLENEENLGLALSMNKAFEFSTGEYIARMDADDICFSERFEKEINILENSNYDLVCTGYKFINEESQEIKGYCPSLTPEDILKELPTTNCIHHPTIMMRRESFIKVNGYRRFPCSQDYDLWLRMYELGMTFYMINEPLLLYRVRTNSTTSTRRFTQAMTLFYINFLFYQWLRTGNDDYSFEKYTSFLEYCNSKYSRYKKKMLYIQAMQKKSASNFALKVLVKLYLFVCSSFIRDSYILKTKIKNQIRRK